jgi:hypothetical protein
MQRARLLVAVYDNHDGEPEDDHRDVLDIQCQSPRFHS